MLVFDVTDDAALSNLDEYWLPKILENADPNVELAVVGNKTDLLNQRAVNGDQAREFISTNTKLTENKRLSGKTKGKRTRYEENVVNSVDYYEVSATQPDDVDKVFKALLTNIIKNEKLQEKILMKNQPERIRLS